MGQIRDRFIDKNDQRDTFTASGRLNVKQEEIDEMLKETPGPNNFTVFLTMFGEKLKGADAEETILNAFKVFDPKGKGTLKKDFLKRMLTTQADRFSPEEMEQMFSAFASDAAGNLDYKNQVYIFTHGEEKEQEYIGCVTACDVRAVTRLQQFMNRSDTRARTTMVLYARRKFYRNRIYLDILNHT
ncbi:myosin regulatory light chain 2, ventricular/cardiac muscle isoform-like [Myxocyprinus asiaticus]|uniref:myosin regulatory light chain 2, ventricular/cardiac muscle isoform-like n=1 Tax=Myxocyprinus asiaticus TaxID=70543 RepID=UPI00222212FF|nr:myosin regulatory light chain 2, ventricular/cardiac muscle isoform-like [Myxocyprinus asiaticus]